MNKEKNNQSEKQIRFLVVLATILLLWIYIWALVLKMSDEEMLVRNYYNLRNMTIEERILWDIIPFNYRGSDYEIKLQKITTVLNCFIFAPFSILICLASKKPKIWKSIIACFLLSLSIEIIQLFTLVGNLATEDLITNTFSGIVGYLIYFIFFRKLKPKSKQILLISINVLIFAATIYSIVTTISISDTLIKILSKTL